MSVDLATPEQVVPEKASNKRRRDWGWLLIIPGMLYLVVFFLFPTIQLIGTSLYDPLGSFEFGYQMTWHFQNYSTAISDNARLFVRSFSYAAIVTVACLTLAYPLAYSIAFKAGKWKNFMLVLVIAPFFTSFLLRTLSWQAILADHGWVVEKLKAVGLLGENGRLLATPFAVIAGLTYNFLPFMTLPIFASLDRLDPRLIEAASDLYSNPVTTLRKVTFPLSLPGVVAGTLLTFIPACGDYINAELLGTPKQYMIGNRIQQAYLVEKDYPLAASLSIILMLIVLVMVLFYIRRAGTERLGLMAKLRRWLADHVILFLGIMVLAYTFVPIGYIIALSFNKPSGRSASAQWNAFTWGNWRTICEPEGMCSSLKLSFQVSITATILSTLLGTLLAFGLARHYWRGRGAANILIFLPMATPEVVMGASLLALFVASGFNGLLGFLTIVIAHVLFCMSFVVVTVKARLSGMDSRLEQAAMDLYANEWQTFSRITLPLVAPGIVAGALLAFSLSFDDFIVTNFTSGNSVTFPLFIYGAKQRGFPPQVFVIGTLMFFIAFVFVIGGLWRRRSAITSRT